MALNKLLDLFLLGTQFLDNAIFLGTSSEHPKTSQEIRWESGALRGQVADGFGSHAGKIRDAVLFGDLAWHPSVIRKNPSVHSVSNMWLGLGEKDRTRKSDVSLQVTLLGNISVTWLVAN